MSNHNLVLLSGGLDSAVAAMVMGADRGLFVDYGQPARDRERIAAAIVADQLGIQLVVRICNLPVPEGVVYPARNMVLAGMAVAEAVAQGCNRVIVGFTHADQADFIDCRDGYLGDLNNVTIPFGVTVVAPLMLWTREKVRDYGARIKGAWSCYTAGPVPCGRCASCQQ